MHLTNPFDRQIDVTGWSWQLPPGFSVGPSPAEGQRISLHPNGGSWTIPFPLKSGRLLKGGLHSSAINLRYRKDGRDYTQAVNVELTVHASPIEIYIGAFIGGILGSLVKRLTLSPELIISAILSVILVFIGQRRKDVQLGVSVEDGIGGAVIGFFVGWFGAPYFEAFLPK